MSKYKKDEIKTQQQQPDSNDIVMESLENVNNINF